MPTVTTAPDNPLVRLRSRLRPLPPPTAADQARWAAAGRRKTVVTEDAPDLGEDVAGMVACAEPDAFPISPKMAAWFREHGGTPVLRRALRAWIQSHHESASPTRRQA